jgi:dTDP-glucose 4,6-dehydratase
MPPKRILITGGCGFLGSHLVEHFLKTTDYDIVVLDKLTAASHGFDRLRDIESKLPGSSARVHALCADLARPLPDGIVQEIGRVDYVIHAAAESHVDNSIVDPLPFLQSNVIGTHNLLMYVRSMPSPTPLTFIVSTDEVYGPAQDDWETGANEWDPFRPANPYAAAKAGGECVAMAYANTYGLPLTIVNTMNLIGERQHAEKFVPLVIRKVIAGETVQIHADHTRTVSGSRFYLHCRTFAHALAWLVEGSAVPLPQKLHVCGEREISNLELAQKIADLMGKEVRCELVDFHSSRPGHDLRYAMDDSLIRQLGWKRPMGLDESLKKTVAWYLANPKWLEMPRGK